MKSLEESIATAMTWTGEDILPFLPYILQDFWEMGASPKDMIRLIEKHTTNYPALKVLDLGCGKGAVSVRIAEKLGCRCWGYDGVKEFIEEARQKAAEYNVETLCCFEQADIREMINELDKFDVIILGAIGQVFGDYYTTLNTIRKCLAPGGLILIDDAYTEDDSSFTHLETLKRSELLNQVSRAGMKIIEELVVDVKEEEYTEQFNFIVQRCNELIRQYPDKKTLFEDYIKSQDDEYGQLENEMVCLTMAIKEI